MARGRRAGRSCYGFSAIRGGWKETRRDLIALTGVLTRRGIEIDPEEWKAVSQELEMAKQVNDLFDPRLQRGEDLYNRAMRGEAVSEEINEWLRDIGRDQHER